MLPTRSYKYRIVDVFTRVPLEGNALAVFTEADDLDDGTMQRIARELNLSETVFVQQAKLANCVKSLRIFTPTREMVFAGHPTVGASYVLVSEGTVPAGTERFAVEEKVGVINIRIEPGEQPMIWLETPPICFEEIVDPALCASILQLDPAELLGAQPQIVDAGNPTLFVPVRSKSIVDRSCINESSLQKLRSTVSKPFCVFVFAPVEQGAYSRMFAPEYGIVEDPATGSATGPLAAYMKRHNLLTKSGSGRFISEQGTKMGRRSLLYFETASNTERDRISVGGYVTPLVEATMKL